MLSSIGNQNPKVLTAPIAIIAIENNFDCSKTITQDQSNQAAGTGYFVQLADPFNNTNVSSLSPFQKIYYSVPFSVSPKLRPFSPPSGFCSIRSI